MGSFFPQPLAVKRPTTGSYVKGHYIEGAPTDLTIYGSWQPVKAAELEALPEGYRIGDFYKIFSGTKLNSVIQSPETTKPDLIIKDDETYQVINCDDWQNSIIPHYEIIVQRINPNAKPST